MSGPRTVRAPRGTQLTCKSWLSEAAYRMIQNNLDPEVAEKPENLVVYGGRGQVARNWDCFDAILESLKNLEDDETLLVQSGKPVVAAHTRAVPSRLAVTRRRPSALKQARSTPQRCLRGGRISRPEIVSHT